MHDLSRCTHIQMLVKVQADEYLDSIVQGHLAKAHAIPTGSQEIPSSIQSLQTA